MKIQTNSETTEPAQGRRAVILVLLVQMYEKTIGFWTKIIISCEKPSHGTYEQLNIKYMGKFVSFFPARSYIYKTRNKLYICIHKTIKPDKYKTRNYEPF